MPSDAKMGLVVGVGLVLGVAMVYFRKEPPGPPASPEPAAIAATVNGRPTAQSKSAIPTPSAVNLAQTSEPPVLAPTALPLPPLEPAVPIPIPACPN